ncbi:MAG: tRNA ((37)-N6)-threonylcarbamoyltransferase complex ATPase subunit type 1 TsaE [Verrucomicrobiota bacterium]|jgi:tRNA threonylcarbamoyladenosine biosynthesis protein TsaE
MIISNSPEETVEIGARFASRLRAGDVVALCGDLGAGKTHFTKGLVRACGGDPQEVSSPTFTLVHEYAGAHLPVFHFDWYRLEEASELLEMGWPDFLEESGVLVVEWAEKFPEALPVGTHWVRLSLQSEGQRKVDIPA